MSKEVNKKGRK